MQMEDTQLKEQISNNKGLNKVLQQKNCQQYDQRSQQQYSVQSEQDQLDFNDEIAKEQNDYEEAELDQQDIENQYQQMDSEDINNKQYFLASNYNNNQQINKQQQQISYQQQKAHLKQESQGSISSHNWNQQQTYSQIQQNKNQMNNNYSNKYQKKGSQIKNQTLQDQSNMNQIQDENDPFADNLCQNNNQKQQSDLLQFNENNIQQKGLKKNSSQAKMKTTSSISPTKKQQLIYKQCQYPDSSLIQQAQQQFPAPQMCQDELELQTLKNKLRTIFTFYASFGDRINVNFLKSNKFHKMMIDAQLRDTCLLTQSKLDLMFVKENKHKPNMDFQTFLNLLAQIAQIKYPQHNQANNKLVGSLNLLLANHFLPLYENIMKETDMGEDEIRFKEEIDELTLFVLKEVSHIMQKIYIAYFPWEPNSTTGNLATIRQRSEGALFIFLKEYDICPSLITKSSAFLLFSEILDTNLQELCHSEYQIDILQYIGCDFGSQFTFSRFCTYLIRISSICYYNVYNQLQMKNNAQQNEIENSQQKTKAEMFVFLLERMELSQGFLNLEKKIHIPHNASTSLIIRKKLQKQMQNENFNEQQPVQINSNNQQQKQQQKVYKTLQTDINQQDSITQDSNCVTDRNKRNQILNEFKTPSPNNFVRSRSEINFNKSQQQQQLQINQKNVQPQLQQELIQQKIQLLTERSGFSPLNSGKSNGNKVMKRNKSQNLNQQTSIQYIYQMNNLKFFKNVNELTKLNQEVLLLVDQNAEAIVRIFQSYCSYGDPLNTTKMKSAKFTKLLRECKLISDNPNQAGLSLYDNENAINYQSQLQQQQQKKELYPGDVDIIFVKVNSKKLTGDQQNINQFQAQDTINGSRSPYKNNYQTNNNNNQKNNNYFEIEHFLQALELIASKLYSNLPIQESFNILLQNHILLYNSESVQMAKNNSGVHIQMLLGILKDEDVVELLRIVHKSIVKFYKYYADQEGLINFEQFAKFCKDFGIFPEIIPKAKLLKIFSTLSSIFLSTEMQQIQQSQQSTQRSHQQQHSMGGNQKGQLNTNRSKQIAKSHFEVIDQHLFVEALSLCAFEIPFSEPQPTNIEKICYLLERMSQSCGPKQILQQCGINRYSKGGANWDILAQVRKRYPDLYVQSNNAQEKINFENKTSFDSLMKQNLNNNN